MDAKELHGYGAGEIAERTGVSLPTARRWKRARRRLPPAIARLLRLVLFGELGEMSRAWRGWTLKADTLESPEGLTCTPQQILALPFLRMQLAAYQGEQRLPRQADWIDGRYRAILHAPGDRRRRSA